MVDRDSPKIDKSAFESPWSIVPNLLVGQGVWVRDLVSRRKLTVLAQPCYESGKVTFRSLCQRIPALVVTPNNG